jgi:hypothetical protein
VPDVIPKSAPLIPTLWSNSKVFGEQLRRLACCHKVPALALRSCNPSKRTWLTQFDRTRVIPIIRIALLKPGRCVIRAPSSELLGVEKRPWSPANKGSTKRPPSQARRKRAIRAEKNAEAICSAQCAPITHIPLSLHDWPLASGGAEGKVEWLNRSFQVESATATKQTNLGNGCRV